MSSVFQLRKFVVTVAKAALELHISHQMLLLVKTRSNISTSPHCLLYHLGKEVIISTSQDCSGWFMPCCVVPPGDTRVVEGPYKDLACEHEITLTCLQRNKSTSWSGSPWQTSTTISLVPAFALIQTHKPRGGTWSIPRQSSTHCCWSLTWRVRLPPCLHILSFLKNLYAFIPTLQSQNPPITALQACTVL